jgi:hypothetical protein
MPLAKISRHRRQLPAVGSALAALTLAASLLPEPAQADQGGLSFWLPGAFGSLAATPVTPGWSMGTIYLHESVRAGGEVAASRAIRLGNANVNLNVTLDARLKAAVDAIALAPSYTFATPVLGVAFGGLLLGEPITPLLVLSLALIAGGIYLVNRPARAA